MYQKKDLPTCNRTECKANRTDGERNYCNALTDNDFGDRECPFFKVADDDKERPIKVQRN